MAPNNALKKNGDEDGPKPATSVLSRSEIFARGAGTNEDIQIFLKTEQHLTYLSELRSFWTLFTFLTRLYGPSWTDHHPGFLMKGMVYMPVIGCLIGIWVSVFYDAFVALGLPTFVSAAACTSASLWLTGCFHEDGLADTSDGFGGGWTRQQIKRIMADSRVGSYGCAVMCLYLITKVQLIGSLGLSTWERYTSLGGGPAILVTHVLARVSVLPLLHSFRYIADDGPKNSYYDWFEIASILVTKTRVICSFLIAYILTFMVYGHLIAIYLILGVCIHAYFAGNYAYAVLGGVMGDFLGATICMAEILLYSLICLIPTMNNCITTAMNAMKVCLHDANEEHAYDFDNLKNIAYSFYTSFQFFVTTLEGQAINRLVITLIIVMLYMNYMKPVKSWPVADDNENNDINQNDNPIKGEGTDQGVNEGAYPGGNVVSDDIDRNGTFATCYEEASALIAGLAKPVGSLGSLEEWCTRLCALQKCKTPTVNVTTLVYAADHGVAASVEGGGEACSAYPQQITAAITELIQSGRAGISYISNCVNSTEDVRVYDVGVAAPMHNKIQRGTFKLEGGTSNFCKTAAMTHKEMESLIKTGNDIVGSLAGDITAIVLGEVGIGNTTCAATIYAAMALRKDESIDIVCGAGTGLDTNGIKHKVELVEKALKLHNLSTYAPGSNDPYHVMQCVGGAEIVVMVGSILKAHSKGLCVLICGYIVTAAALIAAEINPQVTQSYFFATTSGEIGHTIGLRRIHEITASASLPALSPPALSMGMRLGEGTAGTLAVPLLKTAGKLLSGQFATLREVLEPAPSETA